MHIAAHYGHNAIIEYLHSIGFRIDSLSGGFWGGTGVGLEEDAAWSMYTPRRALGLAVRRGCRLLCDGDMRGVSTVKLLLDKGANPNPVPHEIDAPLYDSIRETDDTTITRELIQYGADVEFTVSEDHRRPIVLAAQEGRVNQLQLLLEAGADPWRRGFIPGDTEEGDDYWGTVFDIATQRAKEVLDDWQRAYILAKARRIKDAVNKGSQSSEKS